jgi:hypothetical protein
MHGPTFQERMCHQGRQRLASSRSERSRLAPWRWAAVGGAIVVAGLLAKRPAHWESQPPHISVLVPSHAAAGTPALTVHIVGEHFQPGASVVLWDGSARPTQSFPGSTTVLTATISGPDLAIPRHATVTVVTVDGEQTASSAPAGFVVISTPDATEKGPSSS